MKEYDTDERNYVNAYNPSHRSESLSRQKMCLQSAKLMIKMHRVCEYYLEGMMMEENNRSFSAQLPTHICGGQRLGHGSLEQSQRRSPARP